MANEVAVNVAVIDSFVIDVSHGKIKLYREHRDFEDGIEFKPEPNEILFMQCEHLSKDTETTGVHSALTIMGGLYAGLCEQCTERTFVTIPEKIRRRMNG